ncbi:unnamed protein product [Acanthoscelides obtectus]|uniref:Uncharacterized protein n=1 Tax=Acanthoscelides obtectus TaxID=200917 RepID=A0A9P0K6S6_ACAOB|nr:unnamed protein product [Acanthoscelides obtectus]CAK1683108.1 hypothetical protein AOBTE_LOCUS34085 [Acanthoscelides obtectus]
MPIIMLHYQGLLVQLYRETGLLSLKGILLMISDAGCVNQFLKPLQRLGKLTFLRYYAVFRILL